MKTRHFITLLILVIAAAFVWWLLPDEDSTPRHEPFPPAANGGASPQPQTFTGPDESVPQQNAPARTQAPSNSKPEVRADILEFVRRTREDPTYEWKHPINFFGKVIDENGEPVQGAIARFKWNDLSPDGTSTAQATSDESGNFSLLNETGKAMSVTVSKEGYYTRPSEKLRSYEYAYPEWRFIPDPNNPVIFHLRKKGEAEPLIHGLKLFGTRVDGTMSYVDLHEGKNKLVPPGDLTVQCTRSEWNSERKFDWVFTLSVPDGGIIESSEEFMFLAPEDGYEPSVEIGYRADDDNWRSQEKRKFFLKSSGGKHYARIEITLLPNYRDQGAYDLEWFLNPSGSRNLEYDEAVQPKETFFE